MKILACNWKMYLSENTAVDLSTKIMSFCNSSDIILFPSFIHLSTISKNIKESLVSIGAQNLSNFETGSFTGEVSADQLIEAGAQYVLIGHSERRANYFEKKDAIQQKISLALKSGLKVILCVGESLEAYDNGNSIEFVLSQIQDSLELFKDYKNIILAYEPVWAIGTGLTPDEQSINNMFEAIKNKFQWKGKILYGGSVNENNILWLSKVSIIDGFLIGSASIKFDELRKIISTVYV